MLSFALICLAFALIGIVGLQFTYMFYVDRLYKERVRYLKQLERQIATLRSRVRSADRVIEEQQRRLDVLDISNNQEIEWDEIIDR